MMLGTTTEGAADADNLTIADSGDCGITIRTGTTSTGSIYFQTLLAAPLKRRVY